MDLRYTRENASVILIGRNLEHTTFIINFFLRQTEQNRYTLEVSNILRARDLNLKSFGTPKFDSLTYDSERKCELPIGRNLEHTTFINNFFCIKRNKIDTSSVLLIF